MNVTAPGIFMVLTKQELKYAHGYHFNCEKTGVEAHSAD